MMFNAIESIEIYGKNLKKREIYRISGVLNSVYLQKVGDRCPKNGVVQISRPPSLESGPPTRPGSHGPAMKTCLGHGTTGPRAMIGSCSKCSNPNQLPCEKFWPAG